MAIRRLSITLLLCLCSLALSAQGTGAVRAKITARSPRPDTAYVHALLKLAEAMAIRLPDSALSWSGQALSLGRRFDDKAAEAQAHYVQALAKLNFRIPDLVGAETALSLARTDFDQLRHAKGILHCTLLQAQIQSIREEFLPALQSLDQADSLAQDSSTAALRCLVHSQRAEIYAALQQHRELALPEHQLAVQSARKSDPASWNLAHVLLKKATCHASLAQADSAKLLCIEAADLFEDLEAWQERMHALAQATRFAMIAADSITASRQATNAMRTFPRDSNSLARVDVMNAQASVLLSIAQTDSALRLLRRAIVMVRPMRNPIALNATRINLAQAYLSIYDFGSAIRLADSALILADSLRAPEMQLEAAAFLAKLYLGSGDARNALRYEKRSATARDSLQRFRERRLRSAVRVLQDHQRIRSGRETALVEEGKAGGLNLDPLEKWLLIGAGISVFLIIIYLFVALLMRNARIRKLQVKVKEHEEATDNAYEELARLEHKSSRNSANLEQLVDERTEALKRAVTGLVEANEELDTFIYRASHDLLGPLARLKGLVMMAKGSEQQVDMAKAVDLISAVTVYMDRVLRKLILIREINTPLRGVSKVDIVEMIQKIEPGLTELPGISEPEIVIEDWVQAPVQVDERNLRIVLENLLENACIFRKDIQKGNPRIEVNIKKDGAMVLIEISDLGIGIPDTIRERVFDIFFRGSERSKGNGLGLYLVRRAVDGLGGSVQVESKEGAFTKISVRFPEVL